MMRTIFLVAMIGAFALATGQLFGINIGSDYGLGGLSSSYGRPFSSYGSYGSYGRPYGYYGRPYGNYGK